MSEVTETEIQKIVQRVVSQALGLPTQSAATPPSSTGQAQPAPLPAPDSGVKKVVAIGADHGGFELKETLKPEISALGYEVVDVGTNSKEAVDYPDFAHAVAALVSVLF